MFDLSNVSEQKNETLPAGKYLCSVTEAEMKDTKDGTGAYIRAELTVMEGDAKNRKVFTNFNVKNKNPKAVEIGLSQLKSLLVNAGYPNPNKLDSVSDICGLTVGVKTKIKADPEYGDKAEVSYYLDPKTMAPEKDSSENIPF